MNKYIKAIKTNDLEGLRSLSFYKKLLSDYTRKRAPFFEIVQIHAKGFSVTDWKVMGLNKSNYKNYLSTKDYYSLHPINGKYSRMIDDKLNLKYMCSGTELDKYLPEYYYLIDSSGRLHCLMDVSFEEKPNSSSVVKLLREKGALAIKTIAGSMGAGFYKVEYENRMYRLNGEEVSEEGICAVIDALKGYLIIEYLYPHKDLAEFCPNTANTLRYLMCRIEGKMRLIKSYVRFGTEKSGSVENYGAGGVLCMIDGETGSFTKGNILNMATLHNEIIYEHPSTGKRLEGTIPMWREIQEISEKFDQFLPMMEYLGMDYVVTSKNEVKLLEINSLTSLDGFQMDCSVYDGIGGSFFKEKLEKRK